MNQLTEYGHNPLPREYQMAWREEKSKKADYLNGERQSTERSTGSSARITRRQQAGPTRSLEVFKMEADKYLIDRIEGHREITQERSCTIYY